MVVVMDLTGSAMACLRRPAASDGTADEWIDGKDLGWLLGLLVWGIRIGEAGVLGIVTTIAALRRD
jgi:hypothetical protein